jgi:uncharacterized Zn finger protein
MSDEKQAIKMSEVCGDRDERGLMCKNCGCRDFRVLHTRRGPESIQRERECRNCGKVVWTREKIGL